jgi:hypothetical protein
MHKVTLQTFHTFVFFFGPTTSGDGRVEMPIILAGRLL